MHFDFIESMDSIVSAAMAQSAAAAQDTSGEVPTAVNEVQTPGATVAENQNLGLEHLTNEQVCLV